MRVQPGAELSVGNRQWLTIGNVFGNLTQRQRHRGEDEEADDERQTKKTFRVVMIFHDAKFNLQLQQLNVFSLQRSEMFIARRCKPNDFAPLGAIPAAEPSP